MSIYAKTYPIAFIRGSQCAFVIPTCATSLPTHSYRVPAPTANGDASLHPPMPTPVLGKSDPSPYPHEQRSAYLVVSRHRTCQARGSPDRLASSTPFEIRSATAHPT